MKFSAADLRRINILSRLAQDGALSRVERAELNEYLYVGQVMTILKAGAMHGDRRPNAPVASGRKAS